MKELKFKNCNESYKLDVDGVKIKPYLTWDEFANIYKSVSAQDNAFMRNFSKVVEFAKACTNIDFDGMSEKEIYDICAERGLQFTFEVEIGEYMELDRMIERDENTYNALTSVTESLAEMMKGVNPEQAVKELEGVLSNVNK